MPFNWGGRLRRRASGNTRRRFEIIKNGLSRKGAGEFKGVVGCVDFVEGEADGAEPLVAGEAQDHRLIHVDLRIVGMNLPRAGQVPKVVEGAQVVI